MATYINSAVKYQAISPSVLVRRMILMEDEKAFEGLYKQFYGLLYQQAYNMVHCQFKAEEIVSDVFLKIWNNRKKIDVDTNICAYLSRSIRNQAIDYIRKDKKHKKVNYPEVFPKVLTRANPEETCIYKEGTVQVSAIINALPPKGRHIFRLSREKGMKYQEIADDLNISIKTVETHMRRALIFIRAELKQTDLISY